MRVYIIYLRISQVVYVHTHTHPHIHTLTHTRAPIMYTEGCNKALKKKNGDGRAEGVRRARAARKMKLRGKDAYSTQRR